MGTSVKKSLYWNTILRIPVKIVCFALSIVVARILDPSDFGIMAIAMMIIGYANTVTNFGLNEAIIQRTIVDSKTLNSIFVVDLTISFFLTIVFVSTANILAGFFNEYSAVAVIRMMSLYFLLTSFSGIAHAILRRDMKFSTLALLEASQGMTTSILTLILALFNFGYWSLPLGQIIPMIMFAFLFCVKASWLPRIEYSHVLIKPVIHFGSWNFFKSQINFFIAHIDQIVIGKMIGTFGLGLYDKARSIAVMPSESVLININSVMFSSFSSSRSNIEELNRQFRKAMMLTCVISYPVYAGLILIAPFFISIVLGPKWSEMLLPFQLLLLGHFFKSFAGLLVSFNVGVGKYKEHTIRRFLAGAIFLTLCLLLAKEGIIGIAFSYMILCVVEFFLAITLVKKYLNVPLLKLLTSVFTGSWSTVTMFCCLSYLTSYVICEINILNMIYLIIIGGGIYLLCLFVDNGQEWKQLRDEMIRDLTTIIRRIVNTITI